MARYLFRLFLPPDLVAMLEEVAGRLHKGNRTAALQEALRRYAAHRTIGPGTRPTCPIGKDDCAVFAAMACQSCPTRGAP